MTVYDLCELEALWDFFSVPRATTEKNKVLLKRLRNLVTMKLQTEVKNKLTEVK